MTNPTRRDFLRHAAQAAVGAAVVPLAASVDELATAASNASPDPHDGEWYICVGGPLHGFRWRDVRTQLPRQAFGVYIADVYRHYPEWCDANDLGPIHNLKVEYAVHDVFVDGHRVLWFTKAFCGDAIIASFRLSRDDFARVPGPSSVQTHWHYRLKDRSLAERLCGQSLYPQPVIHGKQSSLIGEPKAYLLFDRDNPVDGMSLDVAIDDSGRGDFRIDARKLMDSVEFLADSNRRRGVDALFEKMDLWVYMPVKRGNLTIKTPTRIKYSEAALSHVKVATYDVRRTALEYGIPRSIPRGERA